MGRELQMEGGMVQYFGGQYVQEEALIMPGHANHAGARKSCWGTQIMLGDNMFQAVSRTLKGALGG